MSTTTADEATRLSIGISKTEWEDLRREGYTPRQILSLWEKFRKHAIRALDFEFSNPEFVLDETAYVTAVQVSRALGLGEFHLSNLRDRGKLEGRRHGRRTIYSRENVDSLLSSPDDGRRSSLAGAFIRWIAITR